jgi:hypothetical protein
MIYLTNKEESKASNEDRPIVLPLNAPENSSIFIQKNAESFAGEVLYNCIVFIYAIYFL